MLLGFKQQFERKILRKEKRHTIRGYGKRRPPRIGERLDCYVNPRQKTMRLLGRWPCTRVQKIRIDTSQNVYIDGQWLDRFERGNLAIADGLSSFTEMMKFWRGRLPFRGVVIHWDPDREVAWVSKARSNGSTAAVRGRRSAARSKRTPRRSPKPRATRA